MSNLGSMLTKLPPGARQRLLKHMAGREVGALVGEESTATRRRDRGTRDVADITQWQEYRDLEHLEELSSRVGIANPYFRVHAGRAGAVTEIDGRSVANFASYDYVGLNGDPRIRDAVLDAVERYGTTVSGSRMVSGERQLHTALEAELAAVYGVDAALIFVGGHATNVSTLSSLFGKRDLILHDALVHNSAVKGAEASGAQRIPFPHNDWQWVDDQLQEHRAKYRRAVIVIEGLYSMDGDVPDLARFVEVKKRHDALLMVDEAHALGVLGKTGLGVAEHAGIAGAEVDIWMGTLSKSLVSTGGYIAGSQALIKLLMYTTPGFVYSVGLAPPAAAAALTALRLMRAEPERVTRLQALSAQFADTARELGLDVGYGTGHAVAPVITQDSGAAVHLSQEMLAQGFNVIPATYPGVEEGRARLRFFLSSAHQEAQIAGVLRTLHELALRIAPKCVAPEARVPPRADQAC